MVPFWQMRELLGRTMLPAQQLKHVTSIYNIILRKMKDKLARQQEIICIKLIWAGHFKLSCEQWNGRKSKHILFNSPLCGYRNIWKTIPVRFKSTNIFITHEVKCSQWMCVKYTPIYVSPYLMPLWKPYFAKFKRIITHTVTSM